MRLNLGACDRRIDGFISVDICLPADVIADLTEPWPWDDSTVSEVRAFDVFEHLPDKRHTMNELWRVMEPGGIAVIGVPDATEGDGGHCDCTHRSYWTGTDFEYYEKGEYARERFRNSPYYGVKADFKVLHFEKKRHKRKRGFTVEIAVTLEAVK